MVRLSIGAHKDLHPGQIISYLKENQIAVKGLQREGQDHLLMVEHLHHKVALLEKGYITVNQKKIIIEDLDCKITYVNIFGAPLSDEILTEHLQVYGNIVGKRQGHYMTHLEVENSIHHWWMLLHWPIPGVVQVGPVRLTIK